MKARLPEQYQHKSMGEMMKQAQKMQEDMQAKAEELRGKEYTAKSGGGMVEAKVNGDHEVLEIKINPEVVDPDDVDMLCDLITAAVNAAVKEAKDDYENEMGEITGALSGLGGLGGLGGIG
ncbi:MAG: YbaB/EbfC family nucleoid-associated protein [Oscillospiraceae bacterium]|jgi:DNA-binding YbaB/EbfC family protein